jgi:hypothetical protein
MENHHFLWTIVFSAWSVASFPWRRLPFGCWLMDIRPSDIENQMPGKSIWWTTYKLYHMPCPDYIYISYIPIYIYIYTHIAHRWSPTPTPSHKGGGDDPYPYPYIPPYIHMYIPAKNPHRQHIPGTRVGRHRQNVHGSAAYQRCTV